MIDLDGHRRLPYNGNHEENHHKQTYRTVEIKQIIEDKAKFD